MTTHRVDSNSTFVTEVTVRESDEYTKSLYVRFDRHYIPEEIRGVNEMFLSIDEVRDLGYFLVQQANKIEIERALKEG